MKIMIDDLNGNVKAFAEACYDMNTIEDLKKPFCAANEIDCNEWKISAEEWKLAVEAALNEMLSKNEE